MFINYSHSWRMYSVCRNGVFVIDADIRLERQSISIGYRMMSMRVKLIVTLPLRLVIGVTGQNRLHIHLI